MKKILSIAVLFLVSCGNYYNPSAPEVVLVEPVSAIYDSQSRPGFSAAVKNKDKWDAENVVVTFFLKTNGVVVDVGVWQKNLVSADSEMAVDAWFRNSTPHNQYDTFSYIISNE